MTRITQIEVEPFRLSFSAADAHRAWAERTGLLLKVRDEDGRIGQGEAAPLPGYSPDTLEDCKTGLRRLAIADPEDVATWIRGLVPAAAFAVETALLDLLAQRRGCSVARYLGASSREVPLAALIPPTLEAARAAYARGIRTLKVKVGRDLQEIDALFAIRRQLGKTVELRLDANGCWDVLRARAHLAALAPLAPVLVEDPVPASAWPDLGPVPVPLAADEPLGADDHFLSAPGLRALVLKPSRLGGLHACLAWGKRAADLGLDIIIGHTYDGPAAMAAAAALALALPRAPLACGLDRHAALEPWSTQPPQILADRIVDFNLPGLGLPPLRLPGP